MQLAECKIGTVCRVRSIQLSENVKRRFEILGMTQNARIEVRNNKKNGAMIVKIRGTRFAIGRQFAQGILVEIQEDANE